MKITEAPIFALSIPDTAHHLSVSIKTVERLIADGQLHAPKIRRRRMVSVASIQRLLKEPEGNFGDSNTSSIEVKNAALSKQ